MFVSERSHRKASRPSWAHGTISSELQVEGKLEGTLGKWHIGKYLLREQSKFTVKGANESQTLHTTGHLYSNWATRPLLIVLVRTLLLTLLEGNEMKRKPGNLPSTTLVLSSKKV